MPHLSRLAIVSALLLPLAACNKPVAGPAQPNAGPADSGVLAPEQAMANQVKSLPWSVEKIRASWKEGLTLGYDVNVPPLACASTMRVVGCTDEECAIEIDRSACGKPGKNLPKVVQKMKLGLAVLAGATLPLGTKPGDWRPVPCTLLGKQAACLQVESRAMTTVQGEFELLRTVVARDAAVVVEHFAGVEKTSADKPPVLTAAVTLKLTTASGL